jgi:hypothetical protein
MSDINLTGEMIYPECQECKRLRAQLAAARALLQKQFYYAPGNYSCLCRDCGKEHVADTRAQRCLECADKRIDAALSGKDATA